MAHALERSGRRPAAAIFPALAPQVEIPEKKNISSLYDLFPRQRASPRIDLSRESQVRVTTLSFTNFHNHGELFQNYLKARHAAFIQRRRWELPQVDGMEFDQYDTPLSRWIVMHEYGEILAGIRLTPTTAQCGIYTYMIRDAQRGLLDSIPTDILFMEAPVKDDIWEATRLFVSQAVSSERRLRIQAMLMQRMCEAARPLGISHIIGIVPAVFQRWMKRIGMSAFPVGAIMDIDGDRTQAAMMDMAQSLI